MKKQKTIAILLASAIVASLVGCNGSTSGSGEMEYTEAELRQAAREAMIATESSSAAASSVDASTAASSVTEASTAASSVAEASATAASSTTEVQTTANPDAAATGASATAATNVNATATAQEAPNKLADHQFVYNGKVNSILNDIGTIMSNLGQYQYRNTQCADQPFYAYKNGEVFFTTGILKGSKPGDELPLDIAIHVNSVRTARNVGIGSHASDINNAYSECARSSYSLGSDYGIRVKFDSYSIYFDFNGKTDTVSDFVYENDVNLKVMYPNRANESVAQSSVNANNTSGNSGTNANATPAPAANNTAPAQTINNTAPAQATNNATPAPAATQNNGSVSEGEVIYNGKKLSILDNVSTIMANLGKCENIDK